MATAPTHTLTTAELPSHGHGSAGAHTHEYDDASMPWGIYGPSSGNRHDIARGPSFDTERDTESAGAHSHANAGGGGAHNNLPPSATVNEFSKP